MIASSARQACTDIHPGYPLLRQPAPDPSHFRAYCLVFSQLLDPGRAERSYSHSACLPSLDMSENSPILGWRSMTFHPSISSCPLLAHPKQKQSQTLLIVVLSPTACAELVVKDQVGTLRIRGLHPPVSLRGRYMSPWRLPTSFEPMSSRRRILDCRCQGYLSIRMRWCECM